jgi:hypothetical protein
MKKANALVVLGVVLMAVGVFLPILKQNDQTINYFDLPKDNGINGDGPGMYLLVVGIIASLMVGFGRSRDIWLPGVIAFWVMFLDFNSIWTLVCGDEGYQFGMGWALMWVGLGFMQAPLWYPALEQRLSARALEPETADNLQPLHHRFYGWIGIIALIAGYFTPIAKEGENLVFYGASSYGLGFIPVLISITLAFILMVLNKDDLLWFVGLIVLGIVAADFRVVLYFAGNEDVALSWGWIPLFLGSLMLIITLLVREGIKLPDEADAEYDNPTAEDDPSENVSA